MGIKELIRQHQAAILAAAQKYGAGNVRVFGSVVRGTADENSDVDFLVDMRPGGSLFDLGGLCFELQEILGRSVDVVTAKGLRQRIRQRVLDEAVSL